MQTFCDVSSANMLEEEEEEERETVVLVVGGGDWLGECMCEVGDAVLS